MAWSGLEGEEKQKPSYMRGDVPVALQAPDRKRPSKGEAVYTTRELGSHTLQRQRLHYCSL